MNQRTIAKQSSKETQMITAYLRTNFVTHCEPVGIEHVAKRTTPVSLRIASLEV